MLSDRCLSVLSCLSCLWRWCIVAKRFYGSIWNLACVGLGPGHIVLDGNPALRPQKGGTVPQFSAYVYCAQTAGWIKMPFGMEVGLDPGDIVLDGNPAPPPQKGAQPALPPQ